MSFVPSSATFNSFSGCDIVASIDVPVVPGGGFRSYVIGELQTVSYSIYRPKFPVKALGYKNPKGFAGGMRTIAGSLVFTVFDRHIVYKLLEEYAARSRRPLMDEMPPFNITVSAVNEYGGGAALRIFGVTIEEEGQVMSVEDILTEQTMQYRARDLIPLNQDVLHEIIAGSRNTST